MSIFSISQSERVAAKSVSRCCLGDQTECMIWQQEWIKNDEHDTVLKVTGRLYFFENSEKSTIRCNVEAFFFPRTFFALLRSRAVISCELASATWWLDDSTKSTNKVYNKTPTLSGTVHMFNFNWTVKNIIKKKIKYKTKEPYEPQAQSNPGTQSLASNHTSGGCVSMTLDILFPNMSRKKIYPQKVFVFSSRHQVYLLIPCFIFGKSKQCFLLIHLNRWQY